MTVQRNRRKTRLVTFSPTNWWFSAVFNGIIDGIDLQASREEMTVQRNSHKIRLVTFSPTNSLFSAVSNGR
jgi:hypothetical protein